MSGSFTDWNWCYWQTVGLFASQMVYFSGLCYLRPIVIGSHCSYNSQKIFTQAIPWLMNVLSRSSLHWESGIL